MNAIAAAGHRLHSRYGEQIPERALALSYPVYFTSWRPTMCNDIDTEVGICRPLRMHFWAVYGIVVLLVLGYAGSYGYLSRRGFAMADEYGFKGFFFYQPEDTDEWRRRETTLRILYIPLIYLDNWMGAGRWPAPEPTWRLS